MYSATSVSPRIDDAKIVGIPPVNPGNSRIANHTLTLKTWLTGYVDFRPIAAIESGANDGIRFGMNGNTGELIVIGEWRAFAIGHLPSRTPTILAMSVTRWRTVVSGADDVIVLDDDSPHLTAGACRPFRENLSHLAEGY
jgi:hypothetical protein